MPFTAQDVRALREKTNVGMMDCKKALAATDGDFEKAIEYLREKGLAAAAKKASRIAAEGMVATYVCDSCGVASIVEVNSETDFVAKNADFQKFVSDIAVVVAKENPADLDALSQCKFTDSDRTVAEMLQEKVLTIGENIKIRRFARFDGETVNVAYTHMGGVIGVLVGMQVSDSIKDKPEVITLGKDIGMQAAAMRPQWLNKEEVPEATLAKEKEILMVQTMNEGKPEKVAEKIVMGRLGKFYQENCLTEQAFVKENKISVAKHIEAVAKELGGEIKLVRFVRFEKGEGLEKREDNFAEEVASMAK